MKLVFFAALTGAATAICPGFNFGIANTHSGVSPGCWRVYDDSCKAILTVFADNPCDAGAFGCSPAVTFNALHLNGSGYDCRSDPNSGTCEGHDIQVCCRNDGN
ncbi:hypothetical protein F5146DRAFT_1133409 [Armillaria mellea]|nr:hypothetical protein F5146DRAFT_1133409 [Armillaria mellea]